MIGIKRLLVCMVLPFLYISAAKADSVEIVDWSTSNVDVERNGTYLAHATVTFTVALSSRDRAFLSIYIEQYPNANCSGDSHTTVGGESWIPISRGRTTRTVSLVYRPEAKRVHVAPGANIWPYKGANIHTPGFREFGTAQRLCKSFYGIADALGKGSSAHRPPVRVRPAPSPPPGGHGAPPPAANYQAPPATPISGRCNIAGVVVANNFSVEYRDSLHGPKKHARLDRIYLIDPHSSSGTPRSSRLEAVSSSKRRFEFQQLQVGKLYELQLPTGWHFQSGQQTNVKCVRPGSTYQTPPLHVTFATEG